MVKRFKLGSAHKLTNKQTLPNVLSLSFANKQTLPNVLSPSFAVNKNSLVLGKIWECEPCFVLSNAELYSKFTIPSSIFCMMMSSSRKSVYNKGPFIKCLQFSDDNRSLNIFCSILSIWFDILLAYLFNCKNLHPICKGKVWHIIWNVSNLLYHTIA